MFIYCILLTSAGVSLAIPRQDLHSPHGNTNTITHEQPPPVDPLKQVLKKECNSAYTLFCLKLRMMNMLDNTGLLDLPILPGVSLTSSELPPPSSSLQRIMIEPNLVDNLLFERLSDYLGSLSLNVRILGTNTSNQDRSDSNLVGTGRKKEKYGGAAIAAGLMSAGTVLAVSLAALAAMSGKAMMAALLALMLAGIAALSKGGDDHKTTYEIVAKPVVTHSHTHSSEVQHGHYKRSLDSHDMIYSQQKPS